MVAHAGKRERGGEDQREDVDGERALGKSKRQRREIAKTKRVGKSAGKTERNEQSVVVFSLRVGKSAGKCL